MNDVAVPHIDDINDVAESHNNDINDVDDPYLDEKKTILLILILMK